MSEELGITVKREEDFSKWYLEVIRKGQFMDQRSPVKGFDVYLPWSYSIWETIQDKFNKFLKEMNVKNAYFPLLIPEKLIEKEKQHFEGFEAEAITVTEVGKKKLNERLVIRPTSETIIYYMFSLWIRSHQDLPYKINQWCNIARWDTKITKPFIRGREFLWQEGHTAHATKEEAAAQVEASMKYYKEMYNMFAIDYLELVRPKSDTFAGANYSVVLDSVMQDGKVVQGPDAHMLGQHFSIPFDIKFTDKDGEEKNVWQTSWGLTTRQIGMIIMHHGDDKGAVLPPEVSPIQAVIIPIIFKGKEKIILDKCKEIEKSLKDLGIRVQLDDRNYSAGFKFNEWELKGVPLRIEIGPKDIENNQITIVKRLDCEKFSVKLSELKNIQEILSSMQSDMLKKSQKFTKENIRNVSAMKQLKEEIDKGGFFRAGWCSSGECEKNIKNDTNGGEIRGSLYKKEKVEGNCIYCGKKADQIVYIARAY